MSSRFKYRSNEKELLDESIIDKELLLSNLKELDILNRTTGGHSISLDGLKKLITDHNRIYHLVDLGCGSGDSLRAFADWARKKKFNVTFTGIDMNADAIEYLASQSTTYPEITGIVSDYEKFLDWNIPIDIVHCSLFCHHLNEQELMNLFTYISDKVAVGFVINDLKRSKMAYYSAWIVTRLLNRTALAKNDAPLSVLRGFKISELNYLLKKTDIKNYIIQKKRLFRLLIVGKTSKYGRISA